MNESNKDFGKLNPNAPSALSRFAFLIGRWRCEAKVKLANGVSQTFPATWVGRYILDGYAIADEYRMTGSSGESTRNREYKKASPIARLADKLNDISLNLPATKKHRLRGLRARQSKVFPKWSKEPKAKSRCLSTAASDAARTFSRRLLWVRLPSVSGDLKHGDWPPLHSPVSRLFWKSCDANYKRSCGKDPRLV